MTVTVVEFKRKYYATLEVLSMLSQALIGFIPAYFAIDGLTKVSGLAMDTLYIKAIIWLFAIILEILGIAILKQATEAYLSRYNGSIPAFVPIVCGVVYVGNMMLLTTLHNVLPENLKAISIGLLCLMPVVGYVSAGMKSVGDEAEISVDDELKRKREVEDEERKFNQELRLMREKSKIENRTTVVPRNVPKTTVPTEERTEIDESGTILERIKTDGYTSYGNLSKDTGIPKTTVVRVISELVNDGKLHRIEDAKKVKFELNGWH